MLFIAVIACMYTLIANADIPPNSQIFTATGHQSMQTFGQADVSAAIPVQCAANSFVTQIDAQVTDTIQAMILTCSDGVKLTCIGSTAHCPTFAPQQEDRNVISSTDQASTLTIKSSHGLDNL